MIVIILKKILQSYVPPEVPQPRVNINFLSQAPPSSSQVVIPTHAHSKNPNHAKAYVGAKARGITPTKRYFQYFLHFQDPSLQQTQFPLQALHNHMDQGFVGQTHHKPKLSVSPT